MLVPLRDFLCPQDPLSSPIFCKTRDYYFSRLSIDPNPDAPEFGETRWIVSEDANVEHLLNVLTSICTSPTHVWRACTSFLEHLHWHKPRQTVLGPTIELLPDDHHSKPNCLFELARLFGSVGNYTGQKRLLEHTLKLERERKNDHGIVIALRDLSVVNRMLYLYGEGVRGAEEALEISERMGHIGYQGDSLVKLAWLLHRDDKNDAAEEAASRAIRLLPEKGQEYRVCQSHGVLGSIYRAKGRREEAIHHFQTALRIAARFNWDGELLWNHYSLAQLFLSEGDFNGAHAHIERAKSHTSNNRHWLGCAIGLQACVWLRQGRFENARSDALHALELFRKLGAARDLEGCEGLLYAIESRSVSGESTPGGEPLPMTPFTRVNFPLRAWRTIRHPGE